MARIRTVKPSLFRHEKLQDLETANPGAHVMLVFIALFGHCDKRGSFPWNPRTLKLDILPFLDFDLSASLVLLREAGFIKHYEIGGCEYGFIPTFKEHQRISGKEAQEPATYPEYNDEFSSASRGSIGEAPETAGREGKGRERKGIDGGADAPPPYAFIGKTIRLTEADLAKWSAAYPNVADMTAELQAADDYITENPSKDGKWYFRVSAWLKRANETKAAEADEDEDLYRGVL